MKLQNTDFYIQRDQFSNVACVIHNLIHILKVNVTKTTIYSQLYGGKSIEEIVNILSTWGIKSNVLEINKKSNLEEINDFAITLIEQNEKIICSITKSKSPKEIRYLDTKLGWKTVSREKFISIWTGILIEINAKNAFGEKKYSAILKKEIEFKKEYLNEFKVINKFLSKKECQLLINSALPNFTRSLTGHEKAQVSDARTSYSATYKSVNKEIRKIYKKAEILLSKSSDYFEKIQCVSYEKGQNYNIHFDAFDMNSNSESILNFGQREFTILIYLNDNFTGGETFFPELQMKIKPKTGTAILFKNTINETMIHPLSAHAGLTIKSGRKFACNLWIRNKVQNINKNSKSGNRKALIE